MVFLLATIAALIGGVVFFCHFHNRPPVAVRARAEVEKGYLDWGVGWILPLISGKSSPSPCRRGRNGLGKGFRTYSLSI
jgi:hypothetical protein